MSVELFVEQLNSDGTLGATSNFAMMKENLSRFKIKDLEDTGDITGLIFEAGRYVAIVMLDENNVRFMMFMDLQKNQQKAEFAASKMTESTRRLFMKNFYGVNAKYKENYNLVKLVVTKSFPSDISHN